MATETKPKKPERITSPKGIAIWPKLNEPDRKWKTEGEYTVKLRLVEKDPATQAFIAKIQEIRDVEYNKALDTEVKAGRAKKKLKTVPLSIKRVMTEPEEGSEEEPKPTGEVDFKFSMKAHVQPKGGREAWDQRPALFDAHGTPIPAGIKVGPGSTIKVSFDAAPFYTAALGFGLTFRMRAVQVIDLKQWRELDAQAYGFDKEDGFDATTAAATTSTAGEFDEKPQAAIDEDTEDSEGPTVAANGNDF